MQWLIDMVIAAIGIPPVYIPKPNCSLNIILDTDMVIDGAWHEIDLSGWIPEGASAVNFSCKYASTDVGDFIRWRTPPDTGTPSRCLIRVVVANVSHNLTFAQGLSTDRKLDYQVVGTGWTSIGHRTRGWWL